MFSAKSNIVKIGDTYIDYVVFGKGDKSIVVIPGLSDGARTVKGMALPLAWQYRHWGKYAKVYIFSRKRNLPDVYSSKELADDLSMALRSLNINKAFVIGVSQGGTVAQYLAIKYPGLVEKMVLTVTYCRPDENLTKTVTNWIELIKNKKYKEWFTDTAEKTYSDSYLKKFRKFYPLFAKFAVLKDDKRFITMANACLTHNSYEEIENIKCPVLIISGEKDKIVNTDRTKELQNKIRDNSIIIYEGLGHAVYEEAKDFNSKVIEFFIK